MNSVLLLLVIAMRSEPCPNVERLADFLLGKLPEPEIDLLSLHLDGCANCQATIDTLEQKTLDESLFDELVEGAADATMLIEPELLSALDRLQQLGPPANRPRPVAPPPMPATVGEYRILEYLGQGGMGTVYKALHRHMERTVAVKLIRADGDRGHEAIKRFQREIKAQAQLDHPNIMTAYDAGEFEGAPYLVMKYVDGIDLARLLAAVGPLPVADACELMKQAAEALTYYAARKLVHRDIKLSNLMLDKDGRLVVLDLGLALFQEERPADPNHERPLGEQEGRAAALTTTRQALGSVDYMAPEQFKGSHLVDVRADIYSLGCTLYALLRGKPPFRAPQYATLAAKQKGHTADPPPPLSQYRQDLPPAVASIVERMLQKSPAERYQTPRKLPDELVLGGKNAWIQIAQLKIAGLADDDNLADVVKREDEPIDLLKRIELPRDAVAGSWRMEDGALVAATAAWQGRVPTPADLPRDYQLTAVATRPKENQGSGRTIAIGLVVDKFQTMVMLDGPGNGRSGLHMLDGKAWGDNETARDGPMLKDGVAARIVCTVHRRHLTVRVDGRTIIDWQGDPRRLSVDVNWAIPDWRRLFVGADCAARFSKLELLALEPEHDDAVTD